MIKIKKITVQGYMEENCYFFVDDETNHGFIIDPGAQPEILIKTIDKNKWIIEKILLTHGHFDHIGAADSLRKHYKIPVCAYNCVDKYLLNPKINLSNRFGKDIVLNAYDYFNDGDIIKLDSNKEIFLQIIYTPGHTTDSCILYNSKNHIAFVGDTIFKNNIGNYLFPGGDKGTLIKSIREKIFTLSSKTKLFPGHGEVTTVGEERKNLSDIFYI